MYFKEKTERCRICISLPFLSFLPPTFFLNFLCMISIQKKGKLRIYVIFKEKLGDDVYQSNPFPPPTFFLISHSLSNPPSHNF